MEIIGGSAPVVEESVAPEARRPDGPAAKPRVVPRPAVGKLLLFGALTAIGPLTIDMYLAAFPAVTADLHTSASVVQLTLTATLAGLAIGQLILGSLSDALGRRNPLIVALALYVVASLVVAVTDSVGVLFVMRFLQGLTAAAGMVISQAMVRDLYSGSVLARFVSRLMLVTSVSPILAPTIGAQFLHFGSWRLMFYALGFAGLVLVVLALVLVKDTLPVEKRISGGIGAALRSYGVLLRSPRYVGLALTAPMAMAAMFAYISSSTFVFQEFYGLSAQTYALIFAGGALTVTAGSQINGFLVSKIHPARIMRVALCAGVVAAVGLVAVSAAGLGLPFVLGGVLLVLSSVGFIMPNNPVIALHEHGDRAGAAAALLGASSFLLGSFVAPVTGLFEMTSATPMAVTMLVCLALGCLAFFALARPKRIIRDIPWNTPDSH